jgi:hypothetical protein
MRIKTPQAHSRFRQRATRMRIRRRSALAPGAAAPQSRMYSLLLPPRYPADRR